MILTAGRSPQYIFVYHPTPLQYGGYTALMLASDKGDTHIVEILLKAGANPDLQNKVRMDLLTV